MALAQSAAAPTALAHRRSPGLVLITGGLLLVLAVSAVAAISLGHARITPAETWRHLWAATTGGTVPAAELTTYQIVWQVRTPRVLLAALVGAGLSSVGAALQACVRNVLADPYLLGVSSGASVGAVAVTVTASLAALGAHAVQFGAFAGALLACAIVWFAARVRGVGVTPVRLVLTGVVLSAGFQALMSVLIHLVPDGESTAAVLFWTMGSFGAAAWSTLPVVAVLVVLAVLVLFSQSRVLDVLALGDEAAAGMGVDVGRARLLMFVVASVATGAMVAVSGAIGFVGLVVPHLVRMVVGAGHRRVLLVGPLVGAIFMVWVDLVARTLVAPRELPLGAITALAGVPVFILLLRRRGQVLGSR